MKEQAKSLSYRIYCILAGGWRQRYIIAVPILLMPLFGALIGIMTPKQYQAHTSMLIQETSKMNPFLEDFAVSAMHKERMAALETLLHSRHILSSVATERGLINAQSTPSEHDQQIALLSNSLTVSMAGKDLIRIDFKSHQPEGMKETLMVVSDHFIEQLLAPERSSMRDSTQFLADLLIERKADLATSELALAEYKNINASQLPELHVSSVARLSQLQQTLAEKEAELAGARKSLGSLDEQLSKTNPVVGRLEEQIVSLQSDLAILRARYTDNHSKVLGTIRKINRLEDERQKALTNTDQNMNTHQLWDMASTVTLDNKNNQNQPLLISQMESLQAARSQVTSLEEETASLTKLIKPLEKQVAHYGEQERSLSQLVREIDVKRELYHELAQRYEMARVTGSLGTYEQEKRIKIIDLPYTPSSPSNFPLVIYILLGIIAGLALGIGLATVLEVTDSSIRRQDQLIKLTHKPVFSRLPPLA